DFTFSSPVTQGSPVTFTASGLYGALQSSITWNFGDTSTATGNPVTHTYSTVGSYNVALSVTFANGTTAKAQHTVNVLSTTLKVDFLFTGGSIQGSPGTFTG